jgi:exosome complex component CSL4
MIGGAGTVVVGEQLVSTLAGRVRVEGGKTVIVERPGTQDALTPQIDDVVLCRISKVDPRAARAKVLAVGETPLRGDFGAMIRVQDVRLTQAEQVEMYKSFRPGDVVRAQVVSLGDKRHYYLATQRNDLGVVGAKCAISGVAMVAASWETMRCPVTNTVEHRKVASLAAAPAK